MAIKTTITDGRGVNGEMTVVERSGLPAGALVYTEPYRNDFGQVIPFSNPTYGFDLNQAATYSGTPDGVHNGTDSALWTGTAISGTWTFDSTSQAQAGTKSIDATATTNNDEAQLERSSAISTGSYTALTGWIYITGWPTSGTKEVRLRIRNAGTDIGTTLDLSNYIETQNFNTWQKFAIPMADFTALTTNFDQLMVVTIDQGGGAAPDYYLDTIQWEETGAPIAYTLEPPSGSVYRVFNITIFAAANVSSTLTSASHQNVAYNEFFGISKLTIGLVSNTTKDGEFSFTGLFQQFADFAMIPATRFDSGGNGTDTWYRFDTKFDRPIVLDSRLGDNLQFIVNDDLSTLQFFRIFANGTTEPIITGENA